MKIVANKQGDTFNPLEFTAKILGFNLIYSCHVLLNKKIKNECTYFSLVEALNMKTGISKMIRIYLSAQFIQYYPANIHKASRYRTEGFLCFILKALNCSHTSNAIIFNGHTPYDGWFKLWDNKTLIFPSACCLPEISSHPLLVCRYNHGAYHDNH